MNIATKELLESRSKSRRYFIEFWAIVLLPWVIDVLTRQKAFTSVLGAFVWGVSVALSVARIRTLNSKLIRTLNRALSLSISLWVSVFLITFFETPSSPSTATGLPRWLLLAHAGLLAAGAGMVLCNLISSCLWLAQNSALKKTSMERRELKWALPSLESLGKFSFWSVDLAFISWGAGFILAVINAILKWSSGPERFGWFGDPKVIMCAVLWVGLAAQFQVSHFIGRGSRKVFWGHVILSSLFLLCFIVVIVFGKVSDLHEPINWFVG